MSKTRLATILAALVVSLVALALPGVASATNQLDAQQWNIGHWQINDNTRFSMKNDINRSLIGYGHRTLGVDLNWGPNRGDWMFVRKPVAPNVHDHRGALTSSEKLALYNTKSHEYLLQGDEHWGIDLNWSRYPSYEWKINLNRSGDTSLYNIYEGDYVVYGSRPFGINLMWLKDLVKQQPPAVGSIHDASVTMTEQQVISGPVPFLGRYGGGGTQAALTKVTNPYPNVTLQFVKPGHSTEECGDTNAVVPLYPGQTMTADQMKTIWGYSSPSLAQGLVFLACANTPYSSVFVNIQYRTTGGVSRTAILGGGSPARSISTARVHG